MIKLVLKINRKDFVDRLGIVPAVEKTLVIKEQPIIKEVERGVIGVEDIEGLSEALDKIIKSGALVLGTRHSGLYAGNLKHFFKESVVPAGTINGVNKTFTLPDVPAANTLIVFVDGLRMKLTGDYTLSGATITFVLAPDTTVLCDYRTQ